MLKAMIVDDEAPARSELRFLLDELGQTEVVAEAASVREAIEKMKEYPCDVIFLDVNMPEATAAIAIRNCIFRCFTLTSFMVLFSDVVLQLQAIMRRKHAVFGRNARPRDVGVLFHCRVLYHKLMTPFQYSHIFLHAHAGRRFSERLSRRLRCRSLRKASAPATPSSC